LRVIILRVDVIDLKIINCVVIEHKIYLKKGIQGVRYSKSVWELGVI